MPQVEPGHAIDPILTPKETAAELRMSPRTLARLKHVLPPMELSARLRGYRRSVIEKYKNERQRIR